MDNQSQTANCFEERNETAIDELCAPYIAPDTMRFVLIFMASLVAITGTFANLLLVVVFIKPHIQFTINPLYLIALAMSDTILCLAYTMLFGVDAIALYWRIQWVYELEYIN